MKRLIKTTYLLTENDKKYFESRIAKLGITKYKVAKELNITFTYLTYILNGKRAFSEVILNGFAKLGIDFEIDGE